MTERAVRAPAEWTLPTSAGLGEAALRIEAGARLLFATRDDGSPAGVIHPLDVRGALVSGRDRSERVSALVRSAPETVEESSVEGWSEPDARAILESVRPITDAGGRPIGITGVERAPRPRTALVMAGGQGQRLRPMTENVPKPLLEVAGRSLLQRVFESLRAHGVERVTVSVHYLAEQIEAFTGDGSRWELDARCVRETRPLGTAGALGLVRDVVDEPFWMINADVLTEADLSAMMSAHLEAGAAVTVATAPYQVHIPYGVVEADGRGLSAVREKPVYRFETNAGLYAFDPAVLERIGGDGPADMVTTINGIAADGLTVTRFPLIERWSDVGRPEDFERAQTEFA